MEERVDMVDVQIEGRGVRDKRVLEAMKKVERHLFVSEDKRDMAYMDTPLPIGEGQTISQPYIVGFMTEMLGLKGNEKVLEIGTGSGYQAAVLAELCKEVFTVEIIPGLGLRAEKLLGSLGYKNIKVIIGDGYLGYEKEAPYDAIIVTCAPDDIPEELVKQLKEGGRMIIPVGSFSQELVLVVKRGGKPVQERVLDVRFVPMLRGQ